MKDVITIRQGELKDAQALANFNQQMAYETENIQLLPDVILAGVTRLIQDDNLGFYLVAESGNEIIASLMVTTEWSDWRNGLFWWVQSVYVLPEFRRQGLYSRLYEQVKRLADKDDRVCGYRLYVEHENNAAQLTYQRNGMLETDYKLYEELRPETAYKVDSN